MFKQRGEKIYTRHIHSPYYPEKWPKAKPTAARIFTGIKKCTCVVMQSGNIPSGKELKKMRIFPWPLYYPQKWELIKILSLHFNAYLRFRCSKFYLYQQNFTFSFYLEISFFFFKCQVKIII